MAEVKEIRTHTKANIKMMAIKATNTRVIEDFIIIYIEISLKVIATVNLEAEAMVMMMSTRQTNTVHHVPYVVAIITLPNIVSKGSMTSMILWKR